MYKKTISMGKNKKIIFSDELEELIEMVVADGKITAKERTILLRRSTEEGIDRDKFELVLEDRLRDVAVNATDLGEVLDTMGRRSVMETQRLAKMLQAENSSSRRVNIIKDFPIPSTEEDLLEFIMTMSARAKNQGRVEYSSGDGYDEKRAYVAKYDEACLKAQAFFPDDPRFKKLFKTTKLGRSCRKIGDGWLTKTFTWIGQKVTEKPILSLFILVILGLIVGSQFIKDEDKSSGVLFTVVSVCFFAFMVYFAMWANKHEF